MRLCVITLCVCVCVRVCVCVCARARSRAWLDLRLAVSIFFISFISLNFGDLLDLVMIHKNVYKIEKVKPTAI